MKKANNWKHVLIFLLVAMLLFGTNSSVYAAGGEGGILGSNQHIDIETVKENAVTIKKNRVQKGEITEDSVEDYYKFTVNTYTRVGFTMLSQADIKYALYNEEGYQIEETVHAWKDANPWNKTGEWRIDWKYNWPDIYARVYPGTYYLVVCGDTSSDNAYGSYELDFEVPDSNYARLKLAKAATVYTGTEISLPKATFYDSDGTKVSSEKYKLSCISVETEKEVKTMKNVGRYYFKVVQNGYHEAGTFFTVKPVKGTIKKLTAAKNGTIKINVERDKQCTGCQVQLSHNRNFTGSSVRTVNITGSSKVIKRLTAGKKYYVRARNYKTYRNTFLKENKAAMETVYGDWGSVKTIRCK